MQTALNKAQASRSQEFKKSKATDIIKEVLQTLFGMFLFFVVTSGLMSVRSMLYLLSLVREPTGFSLIPKLSLTIGLLGFICGSWAVGRAFALSVDLIRAKIKRNEAG